MPRVIHFEIGADNPERAVKFYKDVFAWEFQKFPPMEYWLATTGKAPEPGIDGAIMPRESKQAVINTIGVPSLAKALAAIKEAGGNVVQEKTTIPGVGYFAYCLDTEGNQFGVMQADEKAK